MSRFSGQFALVTGASRGIGQAIAIELAEMGFSLLLVARSTQALENTERRCSELGVEVNSFGCDFERPTAVSDLVNEIENRGLAVNILVNNAGIFTEKPISEANRQQLQREMNVNFLAPAALTSALLPSLSKSAVEGKRAAVINIGSSAANRGYRNGGIYAPTKSALRNFSESLRAEVASQGISVSVIEPGVVNTSMHHGSNRYLPERMIQPFDIAHTVRFIVEMPGTTCPTLIALQPQRDPRN